MRTVLTCVVTLVLVQSCMPRRASTHLLGWPTDQVVGTKVKLSILNLELKRQDYHKRVHASIENTNKFIAKKYDDYLEKLEKLEEDSTTRLKDVGDCVGGNAKKFENLKDLYQKLGFSCGENKIKKADDIINSIIQNIEDAHHHVLILSEQLKACDSGLFSVVCKAKVHSHRLIAVERLYWKIKASVPKAKRLLWMLGLHECTSRNFESFFEEADRILYDVRICIANKPVATTTSAATTTSTEATTEPTSLTPEATTQASSPATITTEANTKTSSPITLSNN